MNRKGGGTCGEKYRPKSRRPPSQSWRTFLQNHTGALAAMDFFVVPTATFRLFYVLVVMNHERRKIVHFKITDAPTAAWSAQQIINAFPDDTAPEYLLRDNEQQLFQAQILIDFFAVPTATFRVLFVFMVLARERRRVLHPNITDSPSAAWTAQ